jgi:hypothetical protein
MQRNKRLRKFCFILFILFGACPAYCSTYFVATDGSDSNSGTIESPFKTINKAVTLVVAGDTIYLRGGVHDYNATISISKSGSSGNLITLQNYQNETVIVDFSKMPRVNNTRGIQMNAGINYWHFKGFTVRYAPDNGIYVNSSYNIFEQIIMHHNADSGITLYANASASPAYNQVINCDSYLNYDPYVTGENADGFAAKGPTSDPYALGPGNVFRGCRAWYNSDDGFDLWWARKSVRIENCWAFRNGIDVWGMGAAFNGDGQGIKLGQGFGAHKVIHCMSYNNKHNGFDLNRSNGDTEVNGVTLYNCTGVNNMEYNFKFPTPTNPPNVAVHTLHNNLSYLGSVSIGNTPYIVNTYNSWNGFTVTNADFASLDANFPLITDPNTYDNTNSVGIDQPRGPDGELPKLAFLRLAPGSALIDAGFNVNEPFEGNAPDLGAFEHLGGDCKIDGYVNLADLACLAANWTNTGCGVCKGADFDDDNKVNFSDLAIMAENWLL